MTTGKCAERQRQRTVNPPGNPFEGSSPSLPTNWQRFGDLAQQVVTKAAAKRELAASGNDKLDRKIGFCLEMMELDPDEPKWRRRWVALSFVADEKFAGIRHV
jgi:hypothetical protein